MDLGLVRLIWLSLYFNFDQLELVGLDSNRLISELLSRIQAKPNSQTTGFWVAGSVIAA